MEPYSCITTNPHKMRHLNKLANLLAAMTMSTLCFAQIPANGLVAHYPFDGSGIDLSGNGLDAQTITATPTTDRFGTANGAYHFSAAQSQYIEVPYTAPFETDSKTVSAWIRTTQSSQYQRIVTLPNSAGYANFALVGLSGVMSAGASYNTSGVSVVASGGTINDGNWHHVVGVIENQAPQGSYNYSVRIYVDGQLTGTNLYNGPFMNANEFLQIGRYDAGWGEYFDGDIDDVLYFDRALSDVEIAGIFSPCQNVSVNNPQTICAGDSYTINGNTYTVADTYTDVLQTIDGCDSTVTTVLTVTPLPQVSATAMPNVICFGQLVDLQGSGANSYQWDNGLGSGQTHTLNPQETTTYTVYGIANGCQAQASVTVNVFELPEVSIAASSNPVCLGESTVLSATGTTVVDWLWMGGIGFEANLTVSPTETSIYTVFGTDANSCVGYAEIEVVVENCVGMNEVGHAFPIAVYPNPAEGGITTISGLNPGDQVTVTDLSGKVVWDVQSRSNSLSISTEKLAPGLYVVRAAGMAKSIPLMVR